MTQWRGIMGEVASKCGEDVAHALMRHLSGTHLYVRYTYAEKGPLALLEREHAEALIQHFAGQYIDIPSLLATRTKPEDRFSQVEAMVNEGLTTYQIAARLGMSQRYVFKIRKAAGAPKILDKAHPDQLPLFEDYEHGSE